MAPPGGATLTAALTVVYLLSSAMAASQDFRLSPDVTPSKYELRLDPDLKSGLFEGHVDVHVSLAGSRRALQLHSAGLNVSRVSVSTEDGRAVRLSKFWLEPKQQRLNVEADEEMPAGRYVLSVDYRGDLNDRIVGFYRSTYKNAAGEKREIATSKFEPTYARQAFPCFDEPAMKAKFSVELVVPLDLEYIALSNMDVVNIRNETERRVFEFAESVPMSTYLACFIVCDFIKKSETIQVNETSFEFSVYATKEQIGNVDFSLQVGVAVTKYYIEYFGIHYPLPKLDMIAIPDFVSGAMEHWGLVTFRETNLLHNSETTSPANAQNIARVVAHEISHMWFGNLVTMKWWNDLWLNEGFASYMQYKALDKYDASWKMLEQFLSANTHSIMALDGTLNSHPIVQTVETPDEITAIFDSVTYNKGAAVIRMLEGFVGEEKFRLGVKTYLENNMYGNTVTQDLLNELEKVYSDSNQNVTYIMDTWTKQMGLPVISIKLNSAANEYELTQKRFLADPDVVPPAPSLFNDKWTIPITFRLNDGSTTIEESSIIWFYDSENTLKIPVSGLGEKKILKLNNDQVGYYRVSYDAEMWKSIQQDLKLTESVTTPSDRANILNDVFTLAQASEETYILALDISEYLLNENDYVPWSVGSSQFSSLKSIMSNSIAYIELKLFVKNLLKIIYPKMEKVTQDSPQVERLLQSVIYNLACSMGHDNCLDIAKTEFTEFLNTNKNIDPNLRNTIYYYGVQQTGEDQWLLLWNVFVNETDAQEKTKLMQALAASTNPAILQRYLTLAWNNSYIRDQDHLSVLQYIAGNPIGTALVWDHVRENWLRLVEKFTLNSRTLGTMIPGITKSFATDLKLKEMEAFFTQYPEAGAGETARKQAIENVKNNIKWLKTHEESVRTWLQSKLIPSTH